VDLYGAQAPFDATGLPTPVGSDVYGGAQAHVSHFALTDGDCRTIAFAVDGNLYDKEGYLIADAKGEDCEQCLEPGVMEMLAIPVPGHCGLYYIVSSSPTENNQDDGLHVAVLDLSQPNPYPFEPERSGRILNMDTELGTLYPEIAFNGDFDTYTVKLDQIAGSKSNAPMLRAVKVGDVYWLYAVYGKRVAQFKVDASGIAAVGGYVPTFMNQDAYGSKSYQRDASVALNANGEVVLAITDIALMPLGSTQTYGVMVMRFDPTNNGALLSAQGLPPNQSGYPDFTNAQNVPANSPGPGQAGPAGCAWVQNASKLVVTGRVVQGSDWVPAIAEYDMANGSWTDLMPVLNIQGDASDFVQARLHRNTAPDGSGQSLYIPYPGGVAAITGADQGTYAFLPSAGFSGVPDLFDPQGGTALYQPRFLNADVAGDASVDAYNAVECCDVRSAYEGYHGYTFPVIPGEYDWTASVNPFGNCPEVLFLDDLIIPAGVQLTIDGMHLKFAPEAHMILRAGAYVDADHSAFTPEDCLGVRWQGIRVEGVASEPTQNSSLQGQLWLDDCLVEEAHVGIWCGREGDAAYGGGFVKCYNSRIRDCIVGARIMQYHRIIGGVEQRNKCSFLNTDFEVTLSWPDVGDNLPKAQLHLYDVNGVGITRCAFTNGFSVELMPPPSRGVGILSLDASYRCLGFGDHMNNHFRHLNAGIVNVGNDPLFANSVDGMWFDRNLVGIYDMACSYSIVKNNKFTALTSTDQLPYLTMGMYIDQSVGYLVERNYFEDIDNTDPQEVGSVGIWFHGEQVADNRIYDNEFHDLTIGNVAEGVHHGGSTAIQTGLQWLCGLYEGETYDQFLLSTGETAQDGTIKKTQGLPYSDFTAGNVFAGPTDCSTTYQPVVYGTHFTPYNVTYYYYNNDQSPDCRPECVEFPDNGPWLTSTGEYYTLSGVTGLVEFDPATHCANGVLDRLNEGVGVHKAAYAAMQSLLSSAVQAYNGQLDQGESSDVIEAIKAEPPWPSQQLRSFLLGKSPLSEEALVQAVVRETPMDPWHLTQVLIANSALSGAIWAALDNTGVLSPFFYNMVREHAEDPSYREILQAEIDQRAMEKELELRLLVQALQEDSTYTGKVDTLLQVLSTDTLGLGRVVAYQLALAQHRAPESLALEALLAGDARLGQLMSLGQLYRSLGYEWQNAGAAELQSLGAVANGGEVTGRGLAWGIRYTLGATDTLPNGILTFPYRSMRELPFTTKGERGITLGAYPDPAQDRLMITYPADAAGTLEVLDARGVLVHRSSTASHPSFMELDVRTWPPGLYMARMMSEEGSVIGEVKCAVIR